MSRLTWQKTTVTGVEGLDQNVFQAPVSGASRDVHVSNARVPAK